MRWLTVMVAICIVGVSPDAMAQDSGVANSGRHVRAVEGMLAAARFAARQCRHGDYRAVNSSETVACWVGRGLLYERHDATDGERIIYRTAVMERYNAAHRCHLPQAWAKRLRAVP